MDQYHNSPHAEPNTEGSNTSMDSSLSETSTVPENNPNTIIIVVLAVIVVVLALMYMWGSRVGTEAPTPETLPVELQSQPEPTVEDIPLSDSDAVQDLEIELNASDVDSLGRELDTLEADLDTELNSAQ